MNEKKSPAVYLCPDNYLVQQAIDAANELGVEVTNDVESHRFISGKAILVTNIYKLVNGKSVFGVGDEGAKINISSLVIDDAHACLDTIEDQFTINIPSGTDAYDELYELFKNALHYQCEAKAIEIENGDITSLLHVPYWVWQDKISEISQILIRHSAENYLLFKWPLLKELPKLCNCVVSAEGIEISPHFIPIHMIPSLINADRKIFMTATLVDDSILVSHFGITSSCITKPIVPKSAGDIGDRMILLPQVITPDTKDEEIKEYCRELAESDNVVVIVPSSYRAKFWEEEADLVLTSKNWYEGVERLKKEHVGLTVLINKYDGIDLPGDECRILIIDGFPDVRRLIDKVKQGVIQGSESQTNIIIQRIEQGMGRGGRSNDDYCVVFLMGRDLTSQLYSHGAIEKFSPGTKAQFDLSEQVAEQIKGKPISEITETIKFCLGRNEDWVKASKGVLAKLKYASNKSADPIIISLRDAFDSALNHDSQKSMKIIEEMKNSIKDQIDKKELGYIKQILAEYTNITDKSEAQKLQLSAAKDNLRLLRPVENIQYHKLSKKLNEQASQCSDFLKNKYTDPNKLIIEVNGILDLLQFKENSSNSFEESLKNISSYIGFSGQRPEQEYKKGPDVLWVMDNSTYLVIECKNEATSDLISKSYCNQLNGSCIWFGQKYGQTCNFTPILIHPSNTFDYAASPNEKIRIITKDRLDRLIENIRGFIGAISVNNELGSLETIREKIVSYELGTDNFVMNYTIAYKISNK